MAPGFRLRFQIGNTISRPAPSFLPAEARDRTRLDPAAAERRTFYEARAGARLHETNRLYQHLIRKHYTFLVPPGQKVLEIGCSLGDLLASVKPARGTGVDFSSNAVRLARERYPEMEFHCAEACEFKSAETFDYILLSDLINELPDVQALFNHLRRLANPHTRLVLSFFNNLWRPCLALAEKLGLKAPTMPQNWLSKDDVENLLHLAGWEVIKIEPRILWPARLPFLGGLVNKWLAPLLPHFCLSIFMTARPKAELVAQAHHHCSVIVPARNEEGNIEEAVRRIPEMGLGTEIIFVEGHSTDNTWEEIQRVARAHPERRIRLLKQRTKGKGGAVREGFAAATGDLLFILDADLTMPPEELPKFYEIARSGTAEFVNGVRLVYPMEQQAMQFLNMVANKAFGVTFSWLLGQRIKDTLCGTKVLFKTDYERIAQNRRYFGEFDPFGDFDLLFGAAKLNLRLVDLPIRYRARVYGQTNISRWRHGWQLLRMVLFAARRLKFL